MRREAVFSAVLLALAAFFVAFGLSANPLHADGGSTDNGKNSVNDALHTAELYEEALQLKKDKKHDECKSKLKEILATKDADPYLKAEAWGLLALVHIQADKFVLAEKCFQKAIDGARRVRGKFNKKKVLRWRLYADTIKLYPTGEYNGKKLSDETVMKEAMKESAKEKIKKLEELVKTALGAKYYDKAVSTMTKAEGIIQEIEILDPGSIKAANEKLWKANAEILTSEVERLLAKTNEAREEVLANKPGKKPKKWKASGLYTSEDEYVEAIDYYKTIPQYNKALRELDRTAVITKKRIDELASLQKSHSEVKYKTNPKTFSDRLKKLTYDGGRRMVKLDVPRKPRLAGKGRVLKAGTVGAKGKKYKPKKR